MAKEEEKLSAWGEMKWFLVAILAFWFVSRSGFGLLNHSNQSPSGAEGTASSLGAPSVGYSKWRGSVKIESGSAANEDYPRYEYVTIHNYNSRDIVDITGWTLANGKDKKYLPTSDKQIKGISNRIAIPKGAKFFIPGGINPQEDVILAPNEEAIVTTGIPFGVKTSFRENICSGYIQEKEDYNYRPSLNNNCPDPSAEGGVKSLDDVCYEFVNRLSACHTPEFKDVVYKDDVPLTGYVDDAGNLSYPCKDFIKKHYNYESCVANHLSDDNFFEGGWRVFLNFPHELWNNSRETITLYDKEGKIVDELSYGY